MQTNIKKFNDELEKLIEKGDLLYYRMVSDLGIADGKINKLIHELKLPPFKEEYQNWYSVSLQVVKQLLPDRLDDFIAQYKIEKRNKIDYVTYTISDYIIDLQITSWDGDVIVDTKAALQKFKQQINIIKSAKRRLQSSLFDMVEVLQADLFDNEIEAAKELWKKGFYRGSGAIAGVVLERHLGNVCEKHNLKTRKKHSTIND
jgi:hypothetical protein